MNANSVQGGDGCKERSMSIAMTGKLKHLTTFFEHNRTKMSKGRQTFSWVEIE